MKYYIDAENTVFAYAEDGSQDEFIRDNLIAILEKEALAIAQPKQSKTQLISYADEKKSILLAEATESIAPIQDALDLGIATDKELKQLNTWKQYRVDLNRIDTASAPDIAWPEKPQ
ncbi:tail fiber assembly protein [Providencia rettgeri]|uniref:tail fiber assembly protein n=1 Tax=Providencia rettgeri TaxID=587 RepID=UPI000807D635|nr:hypothetical protein PR729_14150 [Providencia rettgeri]OBY37757.1 hypothetical protein PR729_02905 [Providencia rettgeri]